MNRKRGVIIAAGLAILVAVIVWLAMGNGISVEVRVAPPGAVSPDDPAARSAQIINKALELVLPVGFVVAVIVAAFFFFRELLRQRAYDRRKPPN